MLTHRHGLGVSVLGGPLYAVGGHDGWSYLNTVERLVLEWTHCELDFEYLYDYICTVSLVFYPGMTWPPGLGVTWPP